MDERDEKLIQMVQQEMPKMVQPKCPNCQYAPLEFLSNVVQTGAGHMISILWCGRCGHVLHMQFLGLEPVQSKKTIIQE